MDILKVMVTVHCLISLEGGGKASPTTRILVFNKKSNN